MPGDSDSINSRDDARLSDVPEYLRNARRIGIIFGSVVLAGIVFVYLATKGWRPGNAIALWGIASFGVAAIVGFLFGMPQVDMGNEATRKQAAPAAAAAPPSGGGGAGAGGAGAGAVEPVLAEKAAARNLYRFVTNDSVQQISDWLTKIIVGLGLVELKSSPEFARRLGNLISQSTADGSTALLIDSAMYRSVGLAAVLYFGAAGFLTAYLMMRLCVQEMIARIERNLTDPDSLEQLLNPAKVAAKAEQSAASIARREGMVYQRVDDDGAAVAKISRSIVAPRSHSRPWFARADSIDDPNKGKFGGESARANWALTAKVAYASAPGYFRVDLSVRPVEGSGPAGGSVTFHLHPTFSIAEVKRPIVEGEATFSLLAWGAFTVGAVVNGEVRLELDLAELQDVPEEFKSR